MHLFLWGNNNLFQNKYNNSSLYGFLLICNEMIDIPACLKLSMFLNVKKKKWGRDRGLGLEKHLRGRAVYLPWTIY